MIVEIKQETFLYEKMEKMSVTNTLEEFAKKLCHESHDGAEFETRETESVIF
jgi:hypothetical protein